MRLQRCFVCDRPVLELVGQFLFFNSYRLTAADDEVLEARAYGACQETMVVRRDGLCCILRRGDLRHLRPVEGGYLCQVTHAEYNLDLSDRGSLAKEIKAELLRQGCYSLPRLIDALGLGPTLFYPHALEQGQLVLDQRQHRLASAPQHRRKGPLWVKGYVVAGMVYDQFLPADVVEVARAAYPPG